MEYDRSQPYKPLNLYDAKFSAHFPSSDKDDEGRQEGESCEPTIVGYNKHDGVLKVRTDRMFTARQSHSFFLKLHIM